MIDKHYKAELIIAQAAAQFILAEANSDPLITVTGVNASKDERHVTILFTTIPDNKEADALTFLKRSASGMREYFKKHTRLKSIPHLEFMVDYGERHRQHIDEIARSIDGEKSSGT
jgi:ribosome-binding factor A